MGELLGHPRLEFDRGRAILPGPEAWDKFASCAPLADITLAVTVLLTMEVPGETASGDERKGRRS